MIKIPLDQLKVILFYGLWCLPTMTAIAIKRYLVDLNILADYSQLNIILNELMQERLIEFKEIFNKQINTWERYWVIPRKSNRMNEQPFPYIYRDDYPKGPPAPLAEGETTRPAKAEETLEITDIYDEIIEINQFNILLIRKTTHPWPF